MFIKPGVDSNSQAFSNVTKMLRKENVIWPNSSVNLKKSELTLLATILESDLLYANNAHVSTEYNYLSYSPLVCAHLHSLCTKGLVLGASVNRCNSCVVLV